MVIVGALTGAMYANVYTFQPNPGDLWNLDHDNWYKWGIGLNLSPDERIVDAVLSFNNIYDGLLFENDKLYVHLLDNTDIGTFKIRATGDRGDNFAASGPKIGEWSDPIGMFDLGFDLCFDFDDLGLLDTLQQFAGNNGVFGFAFDPDGWSWYCNDGVKFKVTTVVPEPGSMMLLGSGLLGLAGVVRRKFVS